MKKNILKKITTYLLLVMLVVSLTSCKKCNEQPDDPCVEHVDTNNDNICDKCNEKLEIKQPCTEHSDTNSDNLCDICGENMPEKEPCTTHVDTNNDNICDECNSKMPVIIVPQKVNVGIKGSSEVQTGKSITLVATVSSKDNSELEDTSVTWEIRSGSEFASISDKGVLTANTVESDTKIEVIARSNANKECYASKIITIVTRPILTDEMFDALKNEKISFEGFVNIDLYTIGIFEKLHSTYTSVVKTAMDGTNWYAEFVNGDTGLTQGIYYKKHNDLACQVGVNFMNEEEYFPMLDMYNKEISWYDSGLYNVFSELSASDFTFDEETFRYVYSGNDSTLINRMLDSANPYEFDPTNLALIIEDGEILGIYSLSNPDYTIAQGYKAIQELNVVINYGDSVEVPTINKYTHEEIHDDLQIAIDNMQNLSSYTIDYHEMSASVYSSGIVENGFTEYITETNCYFRPYDIKYDGYGKEQHIYKENETYGYKKISDTLYNTYMTDLNNEFYAVRAYEKDFANAKPTFAFAPEIYRTYYEDSETGEITYYVDDLMSGVATTYYYGVGNDIALYGIFAARGYTSETESFTPYVTVKDGYIIKSGFYYNIGYMYGVIELEYSDFNNTVIDENINFDFEVRNVPTSWNELTIELTETDDNDPNKTVNAVEYFKSLFNDSEIEEKIPFFGEVLGDTYGFGLEQKYMPTGSSIAKDAAVLYYDVPLDINYTIESSLKAVENYLLSLGFVKDYATNYFTKGNIHIAPTDVNLDFTIYIW